MYFPSIQRHTPRRNVLPPTGPVRDETARREIARLVSHLEDIQREIKTQFTRMAQIQAEVDELKQLIKSKLR